MKRYEFELDLPENPKGTAQMIRHTTHGTYLPKNLKRIGRLAFYDCPRLSGIAVPEGVACGTWAFDNRPQGDNRIILKP